MTAISHATSGKTCTQATDVALTMNLSYKRQALRRTMQLIVQNPKDFQQKIDNTIIKIANVKDKISLCPSLYIDGIICDNGPRCGNRAHDLATQWKYGTFCFGKSYKSLFCDRLEKRGKCAFGFNCKWAHPGTLLRTSHETFAIQESFTKEINSANSSSRKPPLAVTSSTTAYSSTGSTGTSTTTTAAASSLKSTSSVENAETHMIYINTPPYSPESFPVLNGQEPYPQILIEHEEAMLEKLFSDLGIE